MRQSRLMSLVGGAESRGVLVAGGTQSSCCPIFGLQTSPGHVKLALVFTGVSIARSYVLRRLPGAAGAGDPPPLLYGRPRCAARVAGLEIGGSHRGNAHGPNRRPPGNRAAANAGRVSFLELFYDLVFVFAITQLSHLLLHHYTPMGAVETALLMLAVWWVWIYTTWALNWLDPRAVPVRLMLYLSMLLGLFMSMSIPEAFGARGLTFALAYVAMQVGRTLFVLWCLAGGRARPEPILPAHRRVAGRVGAGLGVRGAWRRARRGWPSGGWRSASSTSGRGLITGCRGLVAPPPPTGTFSAST